MTLLFNTVSKSSQLRPANKRPLVKVCDKSAAGFRGFCDLPTTENDVISEKET